MEKYFLGLDIGSSSVKAALVEVNSGECKASISKPEQEMQIIAAHQMWAEQDPDLWWRICCDCIKALREEHQLHAEQIIGVGISYQMHGLVTLDVNGNLLRPSIIWCDGRAVSYGEKAFEQLGETYSAAHLLNAPGNFTAAKLKWVKENEPQIFDKIDKIMLPGDYIAYRFSGVINTTISGLSEGIFWDFQGNKVADTLLENLGIPSTYLPEPVDTFSEQSKVNAKGAQESTLLEGTPILYRAGDQPNNALSLNVLNSGDIAATAGTSGVVYAVTDQKKTKELKRINNFAHVNHSAQHTSIGKLLCINGCGILYKWIKENLDLESYVQMNELAAEVPQGSDGLLVFPFGNGPERMFENKPMNFELRGMQFNRHDKATICRAALEGIAFSFYYGIKILLEDGIPDGVIKAGNDNLFQAEIFGQTLADLTQLEIQIYDTTGAIGAARACQMVSFGQDQFSQSIEKNDFVRSFHPKANSEDIIEVYNNWESIITNQLITK
jgi:xylulokinase